MPHGPPAELKALVGLQIVVDTDSSYVYIGTLDSVSRDCLTLADVDVHDTSDSKSSKEGYTHETRKIGLRGNRKTVYLRLERVLSVSRLDDIIKF